jgi:hypothetical protein
MVRLLVENGADTDVHCRIYRGETPLHISIRRGMKDVAVFLLENGASVEMVDDDHWTPLMQIASGTGGLAEYTGMLLERGAQKTVNYQNIEGDTALHLAIICHGNPKTVKLLLEHGADPLIRNEKGQTALELQRALDDASLLALLERYASKGREETEESESKVGGTVSERLHE